MKAKLIRITTVPLSLETLLKGQMHYMSRFYDITAVCSDEQRLQRVGENECVKTFSVELTRKITPFKDLLALIRLYRFLRRERPQIVHTHTPKAGLIGMLAARLAGVPMRFHTVAGLPLMEAAGLKRRLLDFTEKTTYKCATRIYPNSKGLFSFILENGYCEERKLKIIGTGSSNGINTEFFSIENTSEEDRIRLKKHFDIAENDFVFCFIGRIVKDKGINELVVAFNRIVSSGNFKRTPRLLIVGPIERDLDPLAPETEDEIETNPNIVSVGFQRDIRPFLAISDVFVFPSYREGFPNVVMQAGAMGLPCIVSNINGCNEIIENGTNGLIVPPKETELLHDKMLLLMNDNELRDRLKENARRMITERYEQKRFWKALLDEYRSEERVTSFSQSLNLGRH